MNKLEGLYPVIEANIDKLKLPGVIDVRPGYKSGPDGGLTTQAAVVVVVDPKLPKPDLPAVVMDFRWTCGLPMTSTCFRRKIRWPRPESLRRVKNLRLHFPRWLALSRDKTRPLKRWRSLPQSRSYRTRLPMTRTGESIGQDTRYLPREPGRRMANA